MIHYQVNNKTLYNPFLAYYELYQSKMPISFYCYDKEYAALDWTQEPKESFEQLMDRHAVDLRNRYEKIIMPWSGGTDSQTIYNVFVRNKLHIDEIIICEDGTSCSSVHSKWMSKNHPDSTTKITVFVGPTTDFRKIIHYDDIATDGTINDDWVFQNKSDIFKFAPVGSAPFFDIYAAQNYSAYTYSVVTGYEKPAVYCDNGTWYTRQSDIILSSVMGRPKLECFFLSPLLNLKQSHLVKNFLKKLNNSESEKIQQYGKHHHKQFIRPKIDYQVQSRMSGRHNELILGASALQKNQNYTGYKSISISHNTGISDFDKGEQFLRDAVSNQDQIAIRFLRGMHNVISDSGFLEFLNQQILQTPNNILMSNPNWSKSYNIGI